MWDRGTAAEAPFGTVFPADAFLDLVSARRGHFRLEGRSFGKRYTTGRRA